ncbi:MAG TPA: class II glutamine amidotransferase [Methylomirabilota bacterium]|nr:class II glutamine amidotransferase [Methylomirabilota bacterium]
MCRWLAYNGQPIHLETLVSQPRHSLVHQSQSAAECKAVTNGDGFGVGWYGAFEEPGVYRDILPAWSDDNLKSLCRQIASSLFFAHVRASTGTATSRANCHPFVSGRWMFMHNGQIGGWEKVRRRIESMLPDERYCQRKGTTDSEAIFLIADEALLMRDPVHAMLDALARIRRATVESGVQEALRFAAALTDGRMLYAFRYASDDRPPTLYWREVDGNVTVVSEPLDSEAEGWRAVSPNSALAVSPLGRVEVTPFDVERAAGICARGLAVA